MGGILLFIAMTNSEGSLSSYDSAATSVLTPQPVGALTGGADYIPKG